MECSSGSFSIRIVLMCTYDLLHNIKVVVAKGSQMPEFASKGAAGFDIRAHLSDEDGCQETVMIPPGYIRCVPTGLRMAIPQGLELQLRPRSGLALKHGITLTNSPATIDADYRGEIGVILQNTGDTTFCIEHGDRICQGVFNELPAMSFTEVDELSDTERGEGGFGSTGVK
jgi:dUTP pyrophosphatase